MSSNNEFIQSRNKMLGILRMIIDKKWNDSSEAKKFVILKYIDRYLYSKSKYIHEYIDIKTLKPRLRELFSFLKQRKLNIDKNFVFIEDILDEKCSICLDNITNPSTTSCGHTYCQKCILEFFYSSKMVIKECPMCRAQINMFTLKHNEIKKRLNIPDDDSTETENTLKKKLKIEDDTVEDNTVSVNIL
jgi:hypothetical protein